MLITIFFVVFGIAMVLIYYDRAKTVSEYRAKLMSAILKNCLYNTSIITTREDELYCFEKIDQCWIPFEKSSKSMQVFKFWRKMDSFYSKRDRDIMFWTMERK